MKPVLRKGQLTTWKDDKGFGFIRSSDGSQDVFLHITALKETNHRPQVGIANCLVKLGTTNCSVEIPGFLSCIEFFQKSNISRITHKYYNQFPINT
jgi:cold shock CspA family protein